jgi:hypothetical protein
MGLWCGERYPSVVGRLALMLFEEITLRENRRSHPA